MFRCVLVMAIGGCSLQKERLVIEFSTYNNFVKPIRGNTSSLHLGISSANNFCERTSETVVCFKFQANKFTVEKFPVSGFESVII